MSPFTSGRGWKPPKSKKSNLEEHFWLLLKSYNIQQNFVREYRFDPTRRWKADFADVKNRILVELQGGVWMRGGGGHTTGKAYSDDCEKANAMAVQGWTLLRYTTIEMMRDFFDHYNEIVSR